MTRTVAPIHFCTILLFNRLRAGGVQGGYKCLEGSLPFIRPVPEYQVVETYKRVHNRANCVLHMVANRQFKGWIRMYGLVQNKSRMMATIPTLEACSLRETVDRAS